MLLLCKVIVSCRPVVARIPNAVFIVHRFPLLLRHLVNVSCIKRFTAAVLQKMCDITSVRFYNLDLIINRHNSVFLVSCNALTLVCQVKVKGRVTQEWTLSDRWKYS
jgi:hypothetical protein